MTSIFCSYEKSRHDIHIANFITFWYVISVQRFCHSKYTYTSLDIFISLRINPDLTGSTPYRRAHQAGNVLLYLPHEIRDIIYSFHDEVEMLAISNPDNDIPCSALMQTCKYMWAETKPIRLKSCYSVLHWHSYTEKFATELKTAFRKPDTLINVTRIGTPSLALDLRSSGAVSSRSAPDSNKWMRTATTTS